MGRISLGVDVGGTFTDFVIVDEDSGTFSVGKRLTTPDDVSRAILEGIPALLSSKGLTLGEISKVVHGTTLVTNALIERKGAVTGLITTRGFRDTLDIGREIRYDVYDLFLEKPDPLTPRRLRKELSERLLANGTVLRSVDPAELYAIAAELQAEGVESIAVCLLHSYRNDVHERAVKALLEEKFPGFHISLSVDVAPEIREYDRSSTTVANAYVKPLVKQYLTRLEDQLRDQGLTGSFYVMLSSGGITSGKMAGEYPIRIIESGPAAGALVAHYYGRMIGCEDIISFDMGGTTAKTCLINKGHLEVADEFEVARVHRFKKGSGLPVRVPVIEMIEIGAGGGSIARIDQMGLLKVGPHSAGASPGPACYGLGGKQPTVTDTDLILGYLNPDYFLGGAMALDRNAAERAITEYIADPLGMDLITAAIGVRNVVNENMASAMRIHIAEKGCDPLRYALIAFGGAGPVHAYDIARTLNLKRIVCPSGAGTASALGFSIAPPSVELVHSFYGFLETLDWEHFERIFRDMEEQAVQVLIEAGAARNEIKIHRLADMRYVGQGHEIKVSLPLGPLSRDQEMAVRLSFNESYSRLFGQPIGEIHVEVLTCRLYASGAAPAVDFRHQMHEGGAKRTALKGYRDVYWPEAGGFVTCSVYDRYALVPGTALQGPAVVEERESTAAFGPGAAAKVDEHMNLVIDLDEGS